MRSIKAFLRHMFAPQKRPSEGTKTLLFAAGIYVLLLIWAIVFKFSFISEININSSMSLGTRFLCGFRFFDFFLESNPWRLIRGALIALLNILLFMPWGIYASFFYNKGRSIGFACIFSCVVECIQLFAKFGVFSFEDIALNTLGACLGILLYQTYIHRIPREATQKINQWTVRVGFPFTVVAYANVILAMIFYFS